MLLQSAGRTNALQALLKAEQERGPDFLRLANALSALYPKGSERLLDAMLLALPTYGTTMLKSLHVTGFKSLADTQLSFSRLTVLFGPNAAGKSNVLDAVQALSRIGTLRTLSDALSEPIRGYPIEAFAFPKGGLPELLTSARARFELEADLSVGREDYRYRIAVEIEPGSGWLNVADEYLAQLGARAEPKGRPSLESVGDNLHIRRKSKSAHPRQEPIGLNHSILSDPRLGGTEYRSMDRTRQEPPLLQEHYRNRAKRPRVMFSPSIVHHG